MEILKYLLDSNVVGDAMRRHPNVIRRYTDALDADHELMLCPAVHYEVLRGLVKSGATTQAQKYQSEFVTIMQWTPFKSSDWDDAAQLWAQTRKQGRQFSDVDLLLAALSIRLDAVLVTADDDFSALPLQRENWRD
ncbi:MAG: PIN domain-containing protein [Anaerolineae bacterium]|nr:PIN domain-containing protein [Anaerolineae bacterium]